MVCLVVWVAWEEWVEWECNTIPVQNTLRTRVKQIRNPQKEISGGFFYDIIFYEQSFS